MSNKQEEELRIQERKILRAILAPVKVDNDLYRIRTNHELIKELAGRVVVKTIQKQRIKWLGYEEGRE